MDRTTEIAHRLHELLADPRAPGASDALAVAMNVRGYRDALVVMAARDGDWDGLREAAMSAGSAASRVGESLGGPLTVLGVAQWAQPDPDYAAPLDLWRHVPPSDPAFRMAELCHRVVSNGTPAEDWLVRMRTIDIAAAVEFGDGRGAMPELPGVGPANGPLAEVALRDPLAAGPSSVPVNTRTTPSGLGR